MLVRGIPAPGRLELTDGAIVRLADILVPETPGDGVATAGGAKALLEKLTSGNELVLEPLGTDRQGSRLAEVRTAAGGWLQGELVRAGLAWVWPEPGTKNAPALQELEAEARNRKLGLWASAALGEQSADHVASRPPRFVVVLGRIRSVGKGRRWLYLNFGDDWRHDLTARLDLAERTRPWAATADPAGLEGRLVRVRGWLFAWDGPMIELNRPQQIEIVG